LEEIESSLVHWREERLFEFLINAITDCRIPDYWNFLKELWNLQFLILKIKISRLVDCTILSISIITDCKVYNDKGVGKNIVDCTICSFRIFDFKSVDCTFLNSIKNFMIADCKIRKKKFWMTDTLSTTTNPSFLQPRTSAPTLITSFHYNLTPPETLHWTSTEPLTYFFNTKNILIFPS